MLHGPKKLEADLLEFVGKKIAGGVIAENTYALESDILKQLEATCEDNATANKVALPLAETFTFEEQQLSLLQLASMLGWEKLVDRLIGLTKEKKAIVDFHAQNVHGKTARDYAQAHQHQGIIDKLALAPSSAILPIQDVPNIDFASPNIGKKIKRTAIDFIVSSMDEQTSDFATFLAQVEELGSAKDAQIPPAPPVKFLCAQGGGAKGAAYTGTVLAMDQTGTLASLKAVGGASAGAINAFLIGLGLDAQELELMMRNLNLLDLNDYSGSVTTMIHSALGHSGNNFHNWAAMMLEMIAGNPTITFKEYRELCKTNPNLKEMIFKGTMIHPEVKEVTFSADDTPDVLIADAVRASMSFPGAFEPWDVKIKAPNGKLKVLGKFTDGGVLNNFPITVFNEHVHEDPHYPRIDTVLRTQAEKFARNPCSVGLALCSKLQKLNKDITPFSPRIAGLLLAEEKKLDIGALTTKAETVEEELQKNGWQFHKLAHALVKHKFGLNPEDQYAKYEAYADQTVQIYTENVDTLEFSLTPQKQKTIEASGYNAWMQWFKSRQNPSKQYEHANFELEFVVRDSTGKVTHMPTEPQVIAHFEKLFKEYMLVILAESQACQRNPFAEFKNPLHNQRLKFYSHLILQAINVYKSRYLKTPVETLLQNAFNLAVEDNTQRQRKRTLHRTLINSVVDDSQVHLLISTLISSKNKEDHEKALRIFNGKLSTVFNFMEDSKGALLASAITSGDPVLVKGMFDHLLITDKMLSQTNRPLRYTMYDLFNETSDTSLYHFAMNNNAALIIPILSEAGVDPLKTDVYGKNAFHYAIDANDIDALESLVKLCRDKNIHFESIAFSPLGDTIGHYLIRHATNNLLSALQKKPAVLNKLVPDDALNHEGVTCSELAAHLFYHDGDVKHAQEELKDAGSLAFCRIICAAKGILGKGQVLDFVNAQNELYVQNHRKRKATNKAINDLKSSLIEIADNEELLAKEIGKLSAQECMSLLESPADDMSNFLFECAKNPNFALIAKCLFKRISDLTYSRTGFYDSTFYNEFVAFLNKKQRHMSPLYVAAIANNPVMIEALREYDVLVSGAGPIYNPNALTAAAECGSMKAVEQILLSKAWLSIVYNKIERRLGDRQGRNVMHHLAIPTDEAESVNIEELASVIVAVLTTGMADYKSISSIPDLQGNSPLFYLLSRNYQDLSYILDYLCKHLRKPLHEIFDLSSVRQNGYTDLEWAFKKDMALGNKLASLIPKTGTPPRESMLVSDSRAKIEAEKHADIMHLPEDEYQQIKEERAKPIIRLLVPRLDQVEIVDDYAGRGIAYLPLASAKVQADLVKSMVPSSGPVENKDSKTDSEKAKL